MSAGAQGAGSLITMTDASESVEEAAEVNLLQQLGLLMTGELEDTTAAAFDLVYTLVATGFEEESVVIHGSEEMETVTTSSADLRFHLAALVPRLWARALETYTSTAAVDAQAMVPNQSAQGPVVDPAGTGNVVHGAEESKDELDPSDWRELPSWRRCGLRRSTMQEGGEEKKQENAGVVDTCVLGGARIEGDDSGFKREVGWNRVGVIQLEVPHCTTVAELRRIVASKLGFGRERANEIRVRLTFSGGFPSYILALYCVGI